MNEQLSVMDLVKQYVAETAPEDATEEQKQKMVESQVMLLIRV